MGTTNFDTVAADAFVGDLTGDVTGNVTGGQSLPTATAYASDGAISPAIFNASLTKGSAGAYTLAAPGASNVGNLLYILAGTAQAHVITAASVDGGDTLTYGGAIGDGIVLYGRSATAWSIYSSINVTLSTA
jgi:hypothetical protein